MCCWLESVTGNKGENGPFSWMVTSSAADVCRDNFDNQAENEGEQDKSNDALFLSSENETLPQGLKS
jgi:hypothetical protein